MKRLFTILVLLLVSYYAYSQKATELFNVDFSGGVPPTGWTIENLGSQWAQAGTSNAGGTAPEARLTYTEANTTTRLISPQIDLSGESTVLFSFKHYLDDYSGTGYTIGVATRSGSGSWNDVWTVAPSSSMGPDNNTIVISNGDVGAADFQICVYLSGNMYNFDYWYLDDFVLILPDNLDAELQSINTYHYSLAGDRDIKCTIKNVGLTAITSLDVNYQIDAETVVTENITGVNLAMTDVYDYTFSAAWAATPGSYALKIWVSNINGSGDDDDISNDEKLRNMGVATQSVSKMPMYEEFTSSTCPPCATFNTNTFTPFMNDHTDDIVVVKYQMSWPSPGDPYYTAEGGVRRAYYGVSGVPSLYAGGNVCATSYSAVNDSYTYETNREAYFDLDATYLIEGDEVTVNVDILPYLTVDFTVHIAVIEKETTGNVGSNGETSFKHVMMKMLPDAGGTSVNFTSGVNHEFSESFDMSSTFVEDMDDLLIAVYIQNDESQEMFQAAYAGLLPVANINPSNGSTDVDASEDITISFNSGMRMADNSAITSGNISDFVQLTDPTKADIPFTAVINAGKDIITITPDNVLPESTDITVSVDDAEIENSYEVALETISSTFTTFTYPLSNLTISPTDAATGVNINALIILTFDDAMRFVDESEITTGNIIDFVHVTDPSKADLTYTATINAEKTLIYIYPDAYFTDNTDITVTIDDVEIENIYDYSLSGETVTFTTGTVASTKQIIDKIIEIYPNPTQGIVNVKGAEGSQIKIYDLFGKEITNSKISSNNETINLSVLQSGTYIVKILHENYTSLKKISVMK